MRLKDKNNRMFSAYFSTLVIPLIIVGIIVLAILMGSVSKRMRTLNKKIVNQTVEVFENETVNLLNTSSTIIGSNSAVAFMVDKHSDFTDLNFSAKALVNELKGYMSTREIIDDVAIYSVKNDVTVNSTSSYGVNEYYDMHIKRLGISREIFLNSLMQKKNIYFYMTPDSSNNISDGDVLFCRPVIINGKNMGMFFLTINRKALFDKITRSNNGSDLKVALIGSKEECILKGDGFENEILKFARNKKPGEYNLKKYKVFVLKSGKMGNRYICYMDINKYSGYTNELILIFVLLFLIVFAISFFVAKRKMAEIKKVFLNSQSNNILLSNKLENYISKIRKFDMARILINPYDIWGKEVIYDYNFKYDFSCAVVVNVNDDYCRYDVDDNFFENIVEYINRYITDNLTRNGVMYDYTFVEKNLCAYVFNFEKKHDMDVIRKAFGKISEKVNEICIGIGNVVTDNLKIGGSYENAVYALGICKKYPETFIACYDDVKINEKCKIRYTNEKEDLLLNAASRGNSELVIKILDEIYEANYNNESISIPRGLIFALVNTVYKSIENAYENDYKKIGEYDRVVKNIINNFDTVFAFNALKEIIVNISQKCREANKNKQTSQKILECIDENFTNPDFSLAYLAEKLDISYYYLSRNFTEFFGVNFVTYITKKRIEIAKDLLVNTGLTVNEISEKIGFVRTSTFISLFKKYTGDTPGKFRNDMKKIN